MKKQKKGLIIFILLIILLIIISSAIYLTWRKKETTKNTLTKENPTSTQLSNSVDSKNKTKTITNLAVTSSNKDTINEKLTVINNCDIHSEANLNSKTLQKIYSGEKVVKISTENNFTKVRYSTMDSSSIGYIESSNLKPSTIIPNNFNNFSVPSNVKKVQYGTSGEGRALYYYQIGTGSKVLLMTFEIHGYEDAWAQDGYELTKIAKYLIFNLSKEEGSKMNLNNWTIDIIPSANPDGLLDGYTNYGPGRAEIKDKIDINRDFPSPGFVPTSTARNNTDGSKPLKAPEAKALATLLNSLIKKYGSNVAVVDTHGWLDMSSGNEQLSSYFDNAFNLQNTVIHKEYYGGYWVGYAKMLGATSTIIELPNPVVPENIVKNNYNGKMLTAVNNLITNFKFN